LHAAPVAKEAWFRKKVGGRSLSQVGFQEVLFSRQKS